MTEPPKLPPGSPYTNCGKCCTNPAYMGSMSATIEDIKRWKREGRDDTYACRGFPRRRRGDPGAGGRAVKILP